MQSEKIITVAGGDLRMYCAAVRLAELTDWCVQAVGFSKAPAASGNVVLCGDNLSGTLPCDILVLPIRAGQDGETVEAPFGTMPLQLSELLSLVKSDGMVTGGQLKPELVQQLHAAGLDTVDYLEREELCVANAVPTAEGAIQIAMEETLRTLHGGRALVVGYGRIGMALAPRLQGLGMETTVCARRCETRALAETIGCRSVSMEQLAQAAQECDVVFNTVPVPVLVENVLKALSPDAVIIDLASRPGGTDFAAAKRLGTHVVWALSLPPDVRC